MAWEPASVKGQFRSTIQLLGQLQAKKDAESAITRKDIATLLQQGNVALARSKARKSIEEDTLADLLEVLEQQVGTLLDHFSELEQRSSTSPTLLEASSSIIFAATHTQIRDLSIVSDMITDRLGEKVARSARENRENLVSPRVLQATSKPTPTSAQLDTYLERVAKSYGVSWFAGPGRQDRVNPLSEALNPTTTTTIDIAHLRRLCFHGIPDHPGWLRPRIWKLFMNVLPADKTHWKKEISKQRDGYYDLVRRLLKPFTEISSPVRPVSGPDERLLEVYKHLARIPIDLLNHLDTEPEGWETCPLHQASPENIRISYTNCLDRRLQHLRRLDENNTKGPPAGLTPEIRLEADHDTTPTISLSEPGTSSNHHYPTTLLSSRTITLGNVSQGHVSALLRLLYIHASINPGNLSPYVPSMLVPLYSALIQEVEQEDLAHAEADSFWLFEALVSEFAELEDDEGSNLWMTRLSQQLELKDPELLDQLSALGLHPASPHYSRRWLSSMLTHTLPLTSIYPVWDIVLSRPARERNVHPRLESLIEICVTMMIAAKPLILKQKKTQGLWNQGPLHQAQSEEGFLESLAILQSFPIDNMGGIDTIIQLMVDLSRGQPLPSLNGSSKKDQLGLGARIRVTMWKGFTNKVASPEASDDESSSENGNGQGEVEEEAEDGNETETPKRDQESNSLTSRIANTVWRGITNQSSMEAPSSPVLSPSSEALGPVIPPLSSKETSLSVESAKENASSGPSSLWAYTEKIKDSDTMASIAKLSSNWRAKAILSPWSRSKEQSPASQPQETQSAMTSPVQGPIETDYRRSSLPLYDHAGAAYTPPPRPTLFRNPRDSFIPAGAGALTFSPPGSSHGDPPEGENPNGGLLEKTRHLQSSLLGLARTPSPRSPPPSTPKAGPRPLLLNSSTLITSSNSGRSRINASGHESGGEDWSDVMKSRKSELHRESVSSVSSLSPSDIIYRKASRLEYDSDASTSRVVPLNRRSISPMALASKSYHPRPPSTTSTTSSEQILPKTPAKEDSVHRQDNDSVGVVSPKEEGITFNGNANDTILSEQASLTRKSYRRKPQPALSGPGDTSDSSVGEITSRAARLRSKRYPPRLSNLQIDNTPVMDDGKGTSPPASLTVTWPNSEDQDTAITPRASVFDPDAIPSPSKSPKPKEERQRKVSNSTRHRKISSSNKEGIRRSRSDSVAAEGDDEGYDDLLSAYESEENAPFE